MFLIILLVKVSEIYSDAKFWACATLNLSVLSRGGGQGGRGYGDRGCGIGGRGCGIGGRGGG